MTFNYFRDEYLVIKRDLMINLFKIKKNLIHKSDRGFDDVTYNTICDAINSVIQTAEGHNSEIKELLLKAETIPYEEAMIKIVKSLTLAEADIRLIAKYLMKDGFKCFVSTNYQLIGEFGSIGQKHFELCSSFVSALGLSEYFLSALSNL